MKSFFAKIKNWFSNHRPTKRRLIQLYAFLLYNANIKGIIRGEIFTGNSKYLCVPGLNCYSCPGAIGACPLGALQNALASSGTRAPYYVIGILVLFALLLGRTICGFLCPVGLGQELLYKIPTPKLKKSRYTRIFSYLKYVILIAFVVAIPLMYSAQSLPVPGFCKYICPAGTLGGAIGLLINPSNRDLFGMLGSLFTWKFCVLVVICVASVFIFRFFCRFFCPLGALYGFFNKIALIGVKLDKNKCTDCGLCVAHCKMDVKRVGDHECIQCGECIDVCPAKAIGWKGSKLFVHENAAETVGTPAEEVKPLGALLAPTEGTGVAAPVAPVAEPVSSALQVAPVAASEPAPAPEPLPPTVQTIPEAVPVTEERPKKRRGRNFWLQVGAWAVALCVLVFAFVYYNFFTKNETFEGNQVGDSCYEFTLPVYGSDKAFSVKECRGKVAVINYWATWCTPCVQEIPYFEQLQTEYGDRLIVVAVRTSDTADAEEFIRIKGWDSYSILFAQDDAGDNFKLVGGKSFLPRTMILDDQGVIAYNADGSVTYEKLVELVTPLLK